MKSSIKNLLCSSAAAFALLGALTACDNIAEEDRFIPVEKQKAKKTYLFQEFTGQKCVNCPTGAAIVHNLVEQYGEDAIIVVGLHPTGNYNCGRIDKNILTSDVALTYFDAYGRPAEFPCLMIDGGGTNTKTGTWASWFASILKANKDEEAIAGITLSAQYDPDTREVNVEYDVNFSETYGAETSLILWITENDIHGKQYTKDSAYPTGVIDDYTHNHVLRCALNGDWGTPLNTSLAGTSATGTASVTLAQTWVAENCEIIGYLIDTKSRTGLQATKIAVPAKGEDNTDGN